ncbi:MAG: hypothetical protein FJW68_06595 [Actinobacteria bacterium]|nr:hypothetical protein [Actinomycetota bacterium]
MKRKIIIFLTFLLLLIFACSVLIINGCAKNNTDAITEASPETGPVKDNNSTLPSDEIDTEITEETTGPNHETMPEEEILAEADNILKQQEKPVLLLTLLDKNISGLGKENANKVLDSLQELLIIHETKYTDRLLFEKDGTYQQQLNDFVLGLSQGIAGELSREQVLSIQDLELKDFLLEIFDNGYKLITAEGSWYPVIDYSRFNPYLDYLTDDYRAYFTFKKAESDKTFAKDAALIITWDELAQRVLSAEDFLIKFPQSSRYNEMGDSYFRYLMFYFTGLNNTPAFDYDTSKFKEEVISSYKSIISDPGNSLFFTVELIDKYLDVIAINNNTMNENARSYIRDAYAEVEKKYGIKNPYTGM